MTDTVVPTCGRLHLATMSDWDAATRAYSAAALVSGNPQNRHLNGLRYTVQSVINSLEARQADLKP